MIDGFIRSSYDPCEAEQVVLPNTFMVDDDDVGDNRPLCQSQ